MWQIAIALVLGLSTQASAIELKHEWVRFEYVPAEWTSTRCEHKRIHRIPHNWQVWCEDQYTKKEFSVHLLLRELVNNRTKKTRIEWLYWVTNRTPNSSSSYAREFTGTSLLLTLEDLTKIGDFRLGQSVDNDYAHLNLVLTEEGRRALQTRTQLASESPTKDNVGTRESAVQVAD